MTTIRLRKATHPIGHISTYKDGSQWKKMGPGKWVPVTNPKNTKAVKGTFDIALKDGKTKRAVKGELHGQTGIHKHEKTGKHVLTHIPTGHKISEHGSLEEARKKAGELHGKLGFDDPEKMTNEHRNHIKRAITGVKTETYKTKKGELRGRTVHEHEYTLNGKPVTDKKLLERIESLRVPPAWKDVTINTDPDYYVQAQGTDEKGRRQAIYTNEYTEKQANVKWDRIKKFSTERPKLMRQVRKDINSGNDREKETASVIYLMDKTGFRVGSNRDTGGKVKAYGASSLLKEHVTVKGNKVSFDFIGKKGVHQTKTVTDKTLARIIKEQLKTDGDGLFSINDGHIRRYMKANTDGHIPHDFRGLHATEMATNMISSMPIPKTKKEFKDQQTEICRAVSEHLGNNPTEAKKSYISPCVWKMWEDGLTTKSGIVRKSLNGSDYMQELFETVQFSDPLPDWKGTNLGSFEDDEPMEKSVKGYPVGTVRTWKDGKKYKKTGNGKWSPVGGGKIKRPEQSNIRERLRKQTGKGFTPGNEDEPPKEIQRFFHDGILDDPGGDIGYQVMKKAVLGHLSDLLDRPKFIIGIESVADGEVKLRVTSTSLSTDKILREVTPFLSESVKYLSHDIKSKFDAKFRLDHWEDGFVPVDRVNESGYHSVVLKTPINLKEMFKHYKGQNVDFIKVYSKSSIETKAKVKDSIVNTLSEKTGLPYDTINEQVWEWAKSSNQSEKSKILQKAVAETLDTDLSDWQKSEYGEDAKIEVSPTRKKLALDMYNHTQAELKKHGIKSVKLYRGVVADNTNPVGSEVKMDSNPLESWSVNRKVAEDFAGSSGYVLAMDVPAERIFSTCKTGLGCLNEYEFVVIGNNKDDVATVVTNHQTKKSMPVLTISNSHKNADWIKWRSRESELKVHGMLAKKAGRLTKSTGRGFPVGTIRTWKDGKRYKKTGNGKWSPVGGGKGGKKIKLTNKKPNEYKAFKRKLDRAYKLEKISAESYKVLEEQAAKQANKFNPRTMNSLLDSLIADHTKNDHLKKRPDASPKTDREGEDALSDLENISINGKSVQIKGVGISAKYREKGSINLVGYQIDSPYELAQLLQAYRDPRFETGRVVYTKDNKIVGVFGISSRLPSIVSFNIEGKDPLDWMKRHKERLGADGYYLMHNHPSGVVDPSQADIDFTGRIADGVDGFKGHIIINHDEYFYLNTAQESGVLAGSTHELPESFNHRHIVTGARLIHRLEEKHGKKSIRHQFEKHEKELAELLETNYKPLTDKQWGAVVNYAKDKTTAELNDELKTLKGSDPLKFAAIPHPLLGQELLGPHDIAEIGKHITDQKGYATLIMSSVRREITGIADVPIELFSKNNKEYAKRVIKVLGINTGAGNVFVAGNKNEVALADGFNDVMKELNEEDYITDAVLGTNDGYTSMVKDGFFSQPTPRTYGQKLEGEIVQEDFAKSTGHKYLTRVRTKNGKYRYTYANQKIRRAIREGDKFKRHDGGHWHVHRTFKNGDVNATHPKTGETRKFTPNQLKRHLSTMEKHHNVVGTRKVNGKKFHIVKHKDSLALHSHAKDEKGNPEKVIPYSHEEHQKHERRSRAGRRRANRRKEAVILVNPDHLEYMPAVKAIMGAGVGADYEALGNVRIGKNIVQSAALFDRSGKTDYDRIDERFDDFNQFAGQSFDEILAQAEQEVKAYNDAGGDISRYLKNTYGTEPEDMDITPADIVRLWNEFTPDQKKAHGKHIKEVPVPKLDNYNELTVGGDTYTVRKKGGSYGTYVLESHWHQMEFDAVFDQDTKIPVGQFCKALTPPVGFISHRPSGHFFRKSTHSWTLIEVK